MLPRKGFHFLSNLRVSWQIRMILDTAVIAAPFILISHYPFTIAEFFKEKHRKARRRNFGEVDLDADKSLMKPEEVVSYYRSIGYDGPV